MFANVDLFVVAKAGGAGFAVAILWFGTLDAWWRPDRGRPMSSHAMRLVLKLVAAAVASGLAAVMLTQLLLDVLGAEDPRAGVLVAGLIWTGFSVPFLLLSAVSSNASVRRFLTDAIGALLVIAAIGWVTGLGAGPYR